MTDARGQRRARRGPDFLFVGATRTATTFLHEQLRRHPGIWLPPMKEIYYFSHQRQRGAFNKRHREYARELLPSIARALEGERDGWTNVAWGVRYLVGPRNDRWFLSLFPDLPGRVSGQIEPTYATLERPVIETIARLVPDVRLVFTLRDPIDRAWSSVTKQLARFRDRPMESFSDDEILAKIERQGVPMSCYLDAIERWESVFPKEQLAFGFYEEISDDPAGLVDRLCTHIGAGPHPALDADALARRVNDTRRYATPIPERFERVLAERLAKPTERLAARFGGPTVAWLARIEAALARGR